MEDGWFVGLSPDDTEEATGRIRSGSAPKPTAWPEMAVASGFVPDREAYYETLRDATLAAAETAVREREESDDQQLIHAVRAMDDVRQQANELAERVAEWGGSREADVGTGIEYARKLRERPASNPLDERVSSLAARVVDLDEEATALRGYVEQTAPQVAPNLSMLAGPVLAARLIALSGGLEDLAKQPSGTVQLLGAEDALFAHLQGGAPSPKHGVIYGHEYVRTTPPENRGSASRAVAGKLSIAARVDHYSGDRRPSLQDELDERIERIHARDES